MEYLIYEYTGAIIFLIGLFIYSVLSIITEYIYYIYKKGRHEI